jgi:hypothetical protein
MEHEKEVHQRDTDQAWRRGWLVFAALALLTVIEFVASIWLGSPLLVLGLIALAKAGLIIAIFMRVGDLGAVVRQEVSG